jgi:hypothetical protein
MSLLPLHSAPLRSPLEQSRSAAIRRCLYSTRFYLVDNAECLIPWRNVSLASVRAGNAALSLKALSERLRPVADMLSQALEVVLAGDLDPRQASAMAALAGALVRVVNAGEREERLRALESTALAVGLS